MSDTHEHSKQPNNGQVTWAHILLMKLWYPNGHEHMKRWSISVISLHYSNISNHYNNVNQTSRLATLKQNKCWHEYKKMEPAFLVPRHWNVKLISLVLLHTLILTTVILNYYFTVTAHDEWVWDTDNAISSSTCIPSTYIS